MVSLGLCLRFHPAHGFTEQVTAQPRKGGDWQPPLSPVRRERLHASSEGRVPGVVVSSLQQRHHVRTLSCGCRNCLITPGTVCSNSLRPSWLLPPPGRLGKWGCAGNSQPPTMALIFAVPRCSELILLGLPLGRFYRYNLHFTQ